MTNYKIFYVYNECSDKFNENLISEEDIGLKICYVEKENAEHLNVICCPTFIVVHDNVSIAHILGFDNLGILKNNIDWVISRYEQQKRLQ